MKDRTGAWKENEKSGVSCWKRPGNEDTSEPTEDWEEVEKDIQDIAWKE